jgi:hypothetical protein
MIKPAVYTPLDQLSVRINTLRQRHEQRAANDPHFDYYNALRARSVANSEKLYLSLSEDTRRNEKSADDDWRLTLENRLRVATDKSPASDLDELEALVEAETETSDDEFAIDDSASAGAEDATAEGVAPTTIELVEDDALLQEAGNIVADLVQLRMSDIGANDIANGNAAKLPAGIAANQNES